MGFVPISRLARGVRFRRAAAAGAILGGAILAVGPTPARATAKLSETTPFTEAGVAGRVLQSATPVVEARVFAYQLVERTMQRVLTDNAGRFLFEALPAGIYKIIAHKPGFEPAVLMLQRAASEEAQQVTLELEREAPAGATGSAGSDPANGGNSDFWSARSKIPGDVLRELDLPQLAWIDGPDGIETGAADPADLSGTNSKLRAEVSAVSGIEEITPQSDVRVSGGNVDVAGRLGAVKLFFEGDFQSFESAAASRSGDLAVDGSSRSVSLSLQTPHQGVFDLESSSNRLTTAEDGFALPVEASQYRFGWNREIGENGETSVRGFYLEESGLYNKGYVEPVELPFASRTLLIEGNYTHKLDSGQLNAGLRYRERSGSYSRRFTGVGDEAVSEYLDAFGGGDWRINDTVLLEYGLFTTLRDGSVSLTPRGGVVLQLGGNWQTAAAVAHRVEVDADPLSDDFLPVFVDGALDCSTSEIACYELSVQRGTGEGDQLEFGGSFRELDSTVRMFFSTNFFDHTEGLFLVPGDSLPELHASFRKRLSRSVVTRISASVSEGGGGVYRAVNNRFFENHVSLVSTQIDTQFEATATGVFVAFHDLEQELLPYRPVRRKAAPTTAGIERLEVVVNQNLSTLLDLSTDWAIRLGMELARGASFFHSDVDPEELRRQIMTGVAVRF